MTFPMIATPGTNAPLSPQNAPRLPGANDTTEAASGFGGLLDMGNVSQAKIAGNNGAAFGTALGALKAPAAGNVTITLPGSVPEQQIPASNIELNFETPEPAQLEPVTLDKSPIDGKAVKKMVATPQPENLPALASMDGDKSAEGLSVVDPTSPDGSTEANGEVGQNKPMTGEAPEPVSHQNTNADDSSEDGQRAAEAATIRTPALDAQTIDDIATKPAEPQLMQQMQPAEPAAVIVPAIVMAPKPQPMATDSKNARPANGAMQITVGPGGETPAEPSKAGRTSLASVSKPETAKPERLASQPTAGGEEFAAELADAEGPSAPRIEATRFSAASAAGEIRGTANANAAETSGAARAEQIGRDVGVEIARHVRKGQDEFSVRMDPAELGRIQIRLAFDDQGHLRAHVSADSQAAMELLRRDSGELGRALSDAGVRTDSQSFRFSGGEQSGMGGRQGQNNGNAAGQNAGQTDNQNEIGDGEELAAYQNVRAAGRIDIMA